MVVANVEPLPRFNLGSNVVSARSIRMIRNSESLTNVSRTVNSLSRLIESESESEMFLFDPYKKYIQSNNETILDQGTPIKTSLVANIRAAYYIINFFFHITS